ncbi:MAG: hypothetical protein LBL79_00125 [Prevotella sp.]|nr:hypothetical protein [Prevotella sp.]
MLTSNFASDMIHIYDNGKSNRKHSYYRRGATFAAGKSVFAGTQQVVFLAARNDSCSMKRTCRSLAGSGRFTPKS